MRNLGLQKKNKEGIGEDMKNLLISDIIRYTDGSLVKNDSFESIDSIVIDSRQAGKNSLFVAIIGENQDGHIYIDSAYKNGCRHFLVSNSSKVMNYDDIVVIQVEDTEIAFGKIAKNYRKQFKIPFIGVTGSVGKTTTRDMIYSVVSSKYNTLKNEKNFNNQFGVPMTLFNLKEEHQCAVIEMGMCGFGEIEYLVDIVDPQIAVISNIGTSHIELLGSREGIFKAKMEIASRFDETSKLIVNGEDEFLYDVYTDKKRNNSYKYDVESFGKKDDLTISLLGYKVIDNERTVFDVKIEGYSNNIQFEVPTVGEHNLSNAMSAILVGLSLDMDIDLIRLGLKNFVPTKDRQDIKKTRKHIIINDVYNASPDSMIASLNVLKMYDNRKIAIFGDCLEMGDYAEEGHRRVGRSALERADVLITTGEAAKYIGDEAIKAGFNLDNVHHFSDKSELINSLSTIIKDGDAILVKASRGMKFEDIVNYIEEELN